MIPDEHDLRWITERVTSHYRVTAIYLFGSHAKGTGGRDSDIDLLIIGPSRLRQSAAARRLPRRSRPSRPASICYSTPRKNSPKHAWTPARSWRASCRGPGPYTATSRPSLQASPGRRPAMDERDHPGSPRTAAAKPGAGGRDWSQGRMAAPSSVVPGSPAPGGGGFSLPAISMPTGGGAIRGIDEKLTVGQATGTASLSAGVFTSPARQGFGPKLSLSYDSGAGNGPFGLGWSLPVPSITRKTSNGLPRYDDGTSSDVFILSGAEDLVPLLSQSGSDWVPDGSTVTVGTSSFIVTAYRPRVEGGFARIERWQDTGDRRRALADGHQGQRHQPVRPGPVQPDRRPRRAVAHLQLAARSQLR